MYRIWALFLYNNDGACIDIYHCTLDCDVACNDDDCGSIFCCDDDARDSTTFWVTEIDTTIAMKDFFFNCSAFNWGNIKMGQGTVLGW